MRNRSRVALAALLLIASCSDDGSSSSNSSSTAAPSTDAAATTTEAVPDYSAQITRTEFGIPHIVADDWGSLGFGQGYAYSQDRACTLIDQIIKVRGERAKFFGPGENDENIDSDFAYRHLHLVDDAAEKFGDQPERVTDMVTGYVAGFNAALEAEGAHGWCADEPWVRPITVDELYANLNDITLYASAGNLIGPIATAQPPAATPTDTTAPADTTPDTTIVATGDTTTTLGSNGWAIGSAGSESGGGMLIANPHFPWEGEKRLWESQLTLTTGELNVYGVGLTGVPGVLIGFNDSVAWTHTVSAGYRMTLYDLQLTPGDPTSYVYGDETMEMTSEDIEIEVLRDGATSTETRTLYDSHYGPMLNLPFGWTDTTAFTMRDANIDNTDILEQFFGMDTATSMDEFIDAHRTANGIPWVNTIATSADGRAWYADTAATPNLSDAAIAGWQAEVAAGGLAATVLDNGAILLHGSDPENEWVDDPTATRPGILPFDEQPQLERDDFVFNANDSHWLANPAELLTGYSPLTGPEAVPQTSRTRQNARLLLDPSLRGDDGLFNLTELQAAWFSNRGLAADLLRDQVVKVCDETKVILISEVPFDISPACDVLRNWDGLLNTDSKGAVLWREFLISFTGTDRRDAGNLYSVPFDPADPVGTPNTIATDPGTILNNLAAAITALESRGWALDIALGDVQYDGRAHDERIPIPGGTNVEGAISIVDCCSGANTTAPRGDPGGNVDGRYYTSLGYPVTFGNSFVMTLEFGPDGPHAEAILTYGQPDDPADPNFTAQTKIYSGKSLRPVLFTADEVAAGAVGETITVTGERV